MEAREMSKLKADLIKRKVARMISENIGNLEIDIDAIADTTAINIIREIQAVLIKNPDDFEIVEEIVCIFEKYGVSAEVCHDFRQKSSSCDATTTLVYPRPYNSVKFAIFLVSASVIAPFLIRHCQLPYG